MLCSYIQSHRLLGPGLLHLVIHDGVVDAQPTKNHKCLRKEQKAESQQISIQAQVSVYLVQKKE